MAHVLDEAEDMIYQWIMTLPEEDQRSLHNGADIINCITEDAEEDIKNELWEIIKNSLSYRSILHRLIVHLNEVIETQSIDTDLDDVDLEEEEEEESDQ